MKIIALLAILALSVPSVAGNPFEVSTVLSVAHLNPGDRNVELQFITQNTQAYSVSNVKIYLFLKYPFSASITPNNKLGELTYPGYLIGAGGSGEEYTQYFDLMPNTAHKTFFKIDVDRDAKYGTYDLPYTVYYDKGEYSGKVTLQVAGETLVQIKNVTVASNNSQVEPGEVFKIAVSLENVGDNSIKWLKLTLNPRDKALVPLSSDSEQVFKDLSQGSERDSEFMFSLEKDAEAKNYPIDIVLNYMDERGTEYNETKLTGIVAAGRAALDVAKKTTDPARVKENEPFTLTVKIENTGTGDARGVSAYLESPLEGDTLAYLGEIKKDDYSNAIFTLNSAEGGKKAGSLRISYEDDFGRHEVRKELILIVNPKDSNSTIPAVFGGVTVSALAVYLWKRKEP